MTTTKQRPRITSSNIYEFECHRLISDAVEIGLAPGEWPRSIDAAPDLGNGLPFMLTREMRTAGEFHGCFYTQANGILTIRIFND